MIKAFCNFLFTIVLLFGGVAFLFAGDNASMYDSNNTDVPVQSPPIYHERQKQRYCAVHAVNNIAQYKMTTAKEFQEAAEVLEATEASLRYDDSSEGSLRGANQHVHGDFSIQVITQVLVDHGYSIYQFDRRELNRLVEVLATQIEGLIINAGNHWFAIKKIGDFYYNLDSTARTPERFVDLIQVVTYVSRKRNASVFIVNKSD